MKDETVVGLASIIACNLLLSQFNCMNTIHVVSFRKTILISTIRTYEKIINEAR